MAIIFSKKNTIENIFAMESKSSKDFHFGIFWKFIFISIIMQFFLLIISYTSSLSYNTLMEKALCFVLPVVFQTILIFETIIEYYQNNLIELNIGLDNLLDDKKLQTDFDNIKSLEINERLLEKKLSNNFLELNHRVQYQPQHLEETQHPQQEQLQQEEKPLILNQWVPKKFVSEKNNLILGELKVIDNHLSNGDFLGSLETYQLDLFVTNIVNCAIYYDNVSDDIKTISSLIVSKVFAHAYLDSNISKDHLDMIESVIAKVHKIIDNYQMYRLYEIEGAVSVFKDLANSLKNNKTNGKINDMVIIDMVWCSALELLEHLDYLGFHQFFPQLHNETYHIVCNYLHFTSDTIRSEHLNRFMDIKNFSNYYSTVLLS
ncbi:hypothetical protein DICPUDRAFT_74219 [Dictyostelium purpureum]|uniref:Uncharacterized protein n=1 Tax=Dictyostelium purpureum TaxID=5786 RepID=F0Z750_DICPU|nr:uncharacterized protein DICPUDRAFT_74219 [Dictyostelium purpureum]EGC40277.1 hypothetical protein DICPUDRAFT_74219 [Dictyostelium purpureum]|eukprot:XP_003283213.1 hypothetical protein DICPUDRAFT_74219 [Dictyostelium purpureum]